MSRKPRPRDTRGPEPRVLTSPFEEKLLGMMMTLATELAVTRERTEILELACRKAGVDVDVVLEDSSSAALAARAERHREFVRRLLVALEEPSLEEKS